MTATMDPLLSRVQLLLLDADGVLTDGGITYTDSGEQVKTFHSRDGLGIRILMDAGIPVGVVTGRTSRALRHRCDNLGISLFFEDARNKAAILDRILSRTQIPAENTAFMGDDLIDLPVLKRVGVPICVPEAPEEVRQHARIITRHSGGRGAVREICEAILKAKGLWEAILNRYTS